jgi:hypothetical protein
MVKNALRMRPDRIILGECRGEEAFDMQAMNTGHEGSMATIHANTPRDALSPLEIRCRVCRHWISGDLPPNEFTEYDTGNGLDFLKSSPAKTALRFESVPPGAVVKVSGQSCRTPCELRRLWVRDRTEERTASRRDQ